MVVTGLFDPVIFGDTTIFDIKGVWETGVSETTTISSSIDRIFSSKRSITEPEIDGLFDSVIFGDSSLFHISTRTTAATDTITGIHGTMGAILESKLITDTILRLTAFKRTASDTISISQTLATIQKNFRSISEPFQQMFDDVLFGNSALFHISAQNTVISDTVSGIHGFIALISESKSINDTIQRLIAFKRSASDTTLINATVSIIQNYVRSIIEPFKQMFDSAIFGNSSLFDSTTQNTVISDAVLGVRSLARLLSESVITSSETISRLLRSFRALSETVISAQTLNGVRKINRAISDSSISINSTILRSWNPNRAITESTILSEAISRIKAKIRATVVYLTRHTGSFKITSRNANSYLCRRTNGDGDLT